MRLKTGNKKKTLNQVIRSGNYDKNGNRLYTKKSISSRPKRILTVKRQNHGYEELYRRFREEEGKNVRLKKTVGEKNRLNDDLNDSLKKANEKAEGLKRKHIDEYGSLFRWLKYAHENNERWQINMEDDFTALEKKMKTVEKEKEELSKRLKNKWEETNILEEDNNNIRNFNKLIKEKNDYLAEELVKKDGILETQQHYKNEYEQTLEKLNNLSEEIKRLEGVIQSLKTEKEKEKKKETKEAEEKKILKEIELNEIKNKIIVLSEELLEKDKTLKDLQTLLNYQTEENEKREEISSPLTLKQELILVKTPQKKITILNFITPRRSNEKKSHNNVCQTPTNTLPHVDEESREETNKKENITVEEGKNTGKKRTWTKSNVVLVMLALTGTVLNFTFLAIIFFLRDKVTKIKKTKLGRKW